MFWKAVIRKLVRRRGLVCMSSRFVFGFDLHPSGAHLKSAGLSHGLKTCHRVFLHAEGTRLHFLSLGARENYGSDGALPIAQQSTGLLD